MITRALYNLGYRWFTPPWELGVRAELADLVKSGRLRPGRAVDLGCGSGANAVFLAQNGFDVTGIDFAQAALDKAAVRASLAGAKVLLIRDDLTNLRRTRGPFDLLVDYSTFDDLRPRDRARYVASVVPLTEPGSQFLLWTFEWPSRRRDRLLRLRTAQPGEIQERFGPHFQIERITATDRDMRRLIPGSAAYLMTRS